jgi:small-conductance mechanosensitive channel
MRRAVGRLLKLLMLAGMLVTAVAAAAQQPEPTPDQVKSLLQLLADPVVKGWLEKEMQAPAASPATDEAPPPATSGLAGFVEWRLGVWKAHIQAIAVALPGVLAEVAGTAERIGEDLAGQGVVKILLLLAGFCALGHGCELLFWRLTAPFQARLAASPLDTPASRVRAVFSRFLFGLAWLLSFAVGSIGAFLLIPWPDSLRELVLGYLAAILALRVALVLGRFLFSPRQARFRVVPMTDAAARLWHGWAAAFVGWFAFGYVTIQLLLRFGMSRPAAEILAYLLGLVLLAIALRLIWRPGSSTVERIGGSVLVVLIYVAWVIGAQFLLWTLIVAAALPCMLRATQRSIAHLFRPDPLPDAAAPTAPTSAWAVVVDRGARVLLVVAGVWVLARGWGLDLVEFAGRDTRATRFLIGALDAVVILLVADLLWQLARTAIDRQIATSAIGTDAHGDHADLKLTPEEQRRRGRLRTLLPILRIVLLVLLSVMAVLMALSALGLEIAPLIAGAGVVGVAIGFGSQTLVRDIISGVFYLLDDAFRVGEYIVSGSYRGTVEGFSLRSVKLRHHRGPLFTVPFGTLGAVQNLSRDWVIDKISINVPFDTDIDLVKKVVKQVSKEIMADPVLAKGILEPLKSQGVATMGDFAMQVRVKFMTRPGEQFAVRRAAFNKIKRAFSANGIKIAVPTVSVSGGESPVSPAVAQQAITIAQRAAAE